VSVRQNLFYNFTTRQNVLRSILLSALKKKSIGHKKILASKIRIFAFSLFRFFAFSLFRFFAFSLFRFFAFSLG
jgi:hypothetical protein